MKARRETGKVELDVVVALRPVVHWLARWLPLKRHEDPSLAARSAAAQLSCLWPEARKVEGICMGPSWERDGELAVTPLLDYCHGGSE